MYMYAISRKDLPTHQQAIQAGHAQLKYAQVHGIPEDAEDPTTIWLTAEDRHGLLSLLPILQYFNIDVIVFSDPDFEGYDASAIACLVKEEHRFLFSHLPLWNCYEMIPKPSIWSKLTRWLRSKG